MAIYAVLHSSQIVLGSGKKFQIFFYKFWKKLSPKNAIKMATICSVFDLKCSSSISKSEAMFEKFDVRCCWCSTCSMFGILMFDPALVTILIFEIKIVTTMGNHIPTYYYYLNSLGIFYPVNSISKADTNKFSEKCRVSILCIRCACLVLFINGCTNFGTKSQFQENKPQKLEVILHNSNHFKWSKQRKKLGH